MQKIRALGAPGGKSSRPVAGYLHLRSLDMVITNRACGETRQLSIDHGIRLVEARPDQGDCAR
jgi:hypothetical protein